MSDVTVITGASTGIGKAAAVLFGSQGKQVINISRRRCHVEGVVNLAVDLGVPGFASTLEPQLAELLPARGRITLIHNAARLTKDSLQTLSADDLRQVLAVNLVAPQALNRMVLPHMAPGSSILYVGSTLAEKAVANTFSYVTSKHGLMGMMRATCQDLVGSGIHTLAICPGFTDTEMLRAHLGEDPQVLVEIGGQNGFGRLVTAEEIARLLLFAADNPVLNGAVVHANLGQIER